MKRSTAVAVTMIVMLAGALQTQPSAHAACSNQSMSCPTSISALPYADVAPALSFPNESGEAQRCPVAFGSTVWYKLSVPLSPFASSTVTSSPGRVETPSWERMAVFASAQGTVSTNGAPMDTELAVYRLDPVQGLIFIGCNDDAVAGTLHSAFTFSIFRGLTYVFQIGSKNGPGVMSFQATPDPDNDYLNAAIGVPSLPFDVTQSNLVATNDPGEIFPCAVANTIWYRFVSDKTQQINVNTIGSAFNTSVAVWANPENSPNLALAGCDDNSGGGPGASSLTFTMQARTAYFFQVGGTFGARGAIELHIKPA
ncbi:MAG: hypothetical protein ABR507_11030 [Actinomycetota bacterium]|nr:hypothetical protein [Actinomycetota bacterium]